MIWREKFPFFPLKKGELQRDEVSSQLFVNG